ncbi:MAG: helix-turn-helix domain-containing protein [Bacteroidota bacterium]
MSDKMIAFTIEKILERLDNLEAHNKEQAKKIAQLEREKSTPVMQQNHPFPLMAQDDLLTLVEVKHILKCSRSTVLRLAEKGMIAIKKIGRSVRYSRSQVLEYIGRL